MVLGHRRPQLLELIAQQLAIEWPQSILHITLDRPTATVIAAAERAAAIHPNAKVLAAPFPAVSDRERFMELRNWQLDQIRGSNPEFVAMWDDDHILERPRELENRMKEGHDLLYIKKLFFWDLNTQYNIGIPEHNSVFFFRLRGDDRFPEVNTRVIHAPVGVHDDPVARRVQIQSRLLDIGYMDPVDRQQVFEVYKRAGKIDSATMALVESPTLRHYHPATTNIWYSKLKKVFPVA